MKYIVFYDNQKNALEERYVVPSCQNKAGYVMEVLSELGEKVDVLSPSLTKKARGFFPEKSYSIDDNIVVHLPATLGLSGLLGGAVRRIWQWVSINIFVYSHVRCGDTVIAYHSVALSKVLQRLKRKKNITLILHVEEIYSDVSHNQKHRVKEMQVFECADAFLFPTEKLNQKVNKHAKPYAISHGAYKAENIISEKFNDGRIHCIYAGTFDAEKGGAEIAVKATDFLDDRYCMHILGFGSADEVRKIRDLISERQSRSGCEVIYEGEKRGADFSSFIQRCHIGLSTQNPDKQFNDSSFPSKVLTYMANGLQVVTVKIPVLTESDVNELLSYYEGNDPNHLAEAIKRCNANFRDVREELEPLHRKFKSELQNVLDSGISQKL